MSIGIIAASASAVGSYAAEVAADSPLLWHRGDEYISVSSATASSNYPGDTPANAFDGNASTPWTTNGTATGWLQAQLAAAAVLTQYAITSRGGFASRSPKDWTFEGSNNGSSWTVLDTKSGVTTWSGGDTKTYNFVNTTAYLYYRLNVTANNGDTYMGVTELTLAKVLDFSGNNRHMDALAGVAPSASAGAPKLATALDWGASAGHLRTSYAQSQPTVGTYEGWLYFGSNPAADVCLQTWVPDSGGSGGTSGIYLLTNGKLRLYNYNFGVINIDTPSALSTSAWHHYIGSYGAAGMKLRIDKSTLATNANTATSSSVSAFYRLHGYYNGSGDNARTGALKLAEPAFYPAQLSDARTDAHYDAA